MILSVLSGGILVIAAMLASSRRPTDRFWVAFVGVGLVGFGVHVANEPIGGAYDFPELVFVVPALALILLLRPTTRPQAAPAEGELQAGGGRSQAREDRRHYRLDGDRGWVKYESPAE